MRPGARSKGVAPLFEASSPLACDVPPDIWSQSRERVLPVAGKGFEVRSDLRLGGPKLWQTKGRVQLPHLTHGVLLKFLEAHLVDAAVGDQSALLEEGVVNFPVLADDAFAPIQTAR